MSSTMFKTDLKDILFTLEDVLNVADLVNLEQFKEFNSELFQDVIKEGTKFSEEVLNPLNKNGDLEGAILKDGKVSTPTGFKEAWKKFGDAGWLGISNTPDFGGQGLPETIGIAVKETVFSANPSFALYSMLTSGAARCILSFGSEEMKKTYAEKMISGEWSGTMCLTEPHAGSYVGDSKTAAKPEGDHYKISGTKIYITGGDHDMAENIVHLVLARIPGSPSGTKGISLFVVPKYRSENGKLVDNDVTTVSLEHKMGIKGSSTAVLSFGENDNCHGYLLQEPNVGMKQMFSLMNEARLQVGLQGVGQAAAAYGNALTYAKERTQGVLISEGKNPEAERVPIIEHPDIKDSLMYMKSLTEGIRCMAYATAKYIDLIEYGDSSQKEHFQDLADIHVPVVKSYSTDEGLEVVSKGIQIMGGAGFLNDFPLEQNYRDLRIAAIYEGTNGIQALDLITRKLTINDGRLFKTLTEEFTANVEKVSADEYGLLKEARGIWKDYFGGLILVKSDLDEQRSERSPEEIVVGAKNIMRLFGDVMVGYYLLLQGAKANEKLLQEGIKEDEVRLKAEENENIRFYYNKLVTVQYFMEEVLPRQEGYIRILQRSNRSALSSILNK